MEFLRKPPAILEKAVRDWKRRRAVPAVFHFQEPGDYVTVTVSEKTNQREVDVETREFEYQAKQFLGSL